MAWLIGFFYPDFSVTSESARSFISTSNQIQATILAIVISLTLLAVEMTASKYSPRVIEIFKKNATLWFFIFSYILAIIIGSIILVNIDSSNPLISATLGTLYVLVLDGYLSLMFFIYVYNTLDFLNAEKIVKSLANLIDVKTINWRVDPFQSVFDVIYGAIKINDFTTMSTGLVCAEERFKEIIGESPVNYEGNYIIFRFFDDMKRCGFLLIEKKEEKYAFEIINRLKTINEWAFKEQNWLVLNGSCPTIEEISIKACEYGMVSVIDHSLTTLKETGESVEKIEGLAQDNKVTKKWGNTMFTVTKSISNIGNASFRYGLDTSAEKVTEILDRFGRYAIEKELTFEYDFVFCRMSEVILESIKENKIALANSFVRKLQYLGGYSISHNRNKEIFWILDGLKEIGKYAAHQKKAEVVQAVVVAFRYIALDAMEKEMNDVQKDAIELSKNFQLIYPEFFEDETKIRLFCYNDLDSITISEEDYRSECDQEFSILNEYLRPLDDSDGDSDDDTTVISL